MDCNLFIFYHILSCTRLHTFRSSLKVIWSLMLLCFFSPLIKSITLLTGLWIEKHTNNYFRYPIHDKGMTARGFISPSRWSLLPANTISNGEFYLVLFLSWSDIAYHFTYYWLLCASVSFILVWRASSIAKSLTSRSAMPSCASIFVISFIYM